MDRHNPRKVREPQRFGLVAEDVRQNEVIPVRANGMRRNCVVDEKAMAIAAQTLD